MYWPNHCLHPIFLYTYFLLFQFLSLFSWYSRYFIYLFSLLVSEEMVQLHGLKFNKLKRIYGENSHLCPAAIQVFSLETTTIISFLCIITQIYSISGWIKVNLYILIELFMIIYLTS